MYEEAEISYGSQSLSSICYVCLCTTRKMLPLGEYADIFNRIICFPTKINQQYIMLCWECLAVLKKIKFFETKCYIAQKILHAKWETQQPPRCLSTLVTTPVKINNHTVIHLNENHEIKYENKLFENNTKVLCENFIHTDENDVCCTKFEESTSMEDDVYSTENFEYSRSEAGNDYLKNEIKVLNLNCNEINTSDIIIKTDAHEVESDNCDTKYNTDLKNDIKTLLNKSSKVKCIRKEKMVRRNGIRKKDLEEHFRIVSVSPEELKKFRSKCKIDADELEFWRETEKAIDVYVDQPYKCNRCISVFPSVKKKFEHDKKYHDSNTGVFTCDVCTSQFEHKQELATHVSKHYYMHQCNLCQFRCISRYVIKSHMGRHKRIFTCMHCEACFSNINLFYKHFKSSHSVFICDHCGKRCRTKYTLEKHMRHHSEKNICLICNKVYASRNSLRNHSEMKHTETSSEMSYCVKCDKQFANVPLYRRHVQTSKAHAAERDADRNKKQVSCPICGNVYSRKTYMMNHYRHVHMKQSKHYCTDCDRHFLNRTRYVEHRKYHHEGETKAKNKVCNICGRGFAANRTLVNHIRTHSGERPYECQYCDAKFTQKHGMLSHIKYIHMKGKRRGFQ